MSEKERIIVSMTSYPKRIMNIEKSIFYLLTKQTVKPDEIHLWLSIEEYPNQYNDLPENIRLLIDSDTIILHWVQKNTYVHKRHEYFKIAQDNDLVFLICALLILTSPVETITKSVLFEKSIELVFEFVPLIVKLPTILRLSFV